MKTFPQSIQNRKILGIHSDHVNEVPFLQTSEYFHTVYIQCQVCEWILELFAAFVFWNFLLQKYINKPTTAEVRETIKKLIDSVPMVEDLFQKST